MIEIKVMIVRSVAHYLIEMFFKVIIVLIISVISYCEMVCKINFIPKDFKLSLILFMELYALMLILDSLEGHLLSKSCFFYLRLTKIAHIIPGTCCEHLHTSCSSLANIHASLCTIKMFKIISSPANYH